MKSVENDHPCSGRGCVCQPTNFLRLVYIGMCGYFCDGCAECLINQDLASPVSVPEVQSTLKKVERNQTKDNERDDDSHVTVTDVI